MKRGGRDIAVIGGGWAGCAAAVTLADKGHRVVLIEAARTLGGRARGVELDGRQLDNGQHILLGAYSATLRLMSKVGVDARKVLLRLPLQMRYPPGSGGMDFIAPRLPAPLHLIAALIRARGLDRSDKMALARFSTAARWMDWRLNQDCTVSELLQRHEQTQRLVALLWRPLCIAALNTPPERASAQVFLNVLRDSLGARRASSDMLISRIDLSALLPLAAARFIEKRGGKVACGARVARLSRAPDNIGWCLHGAGLPNERYDAVVVATGAGAAATLLADHSPVPELAAMTHEPITTCYLQYSGMLRLPQPFHALQDAPEAARWGQFVFDRGQLDETYAGLLAVVVSASGDAVAEGNAGMATAVARQLATDFGIAELAHPVWTRTITEKRATFSCTPGLPRPPNATSSAGLWLAGDYTAGDYPATLEGAVRSGVGTAKAIDSGA